MEPQDSSAYVEHPDLVDAELVDDHGPAFIPPLRVEDDENE